MNGFFSSSTIQREKPAGLIPKCGECGLYKQCESPKMPVYGKGQRGVLVVGEAPGADEDERNRPFIGKAGQHLRGVLDAIDVDLDRDAWTTNALICHPPKNATPDAKQISHCRPNVLAAIRKYQPTVIVTLGRSALVSVLEPFWRDDVGQMERWTSSQVPLPQHWVCPTYHPSYLLRMSNPLLDRIFQNDLERAFAIEDLPKPQDPFNIEEIYNDEEVYRALRDMNDQGGWVAVDYETNCLKPEWPEAKIVSCAVSNGDRTISYPWVGKAREATSLFLSSSRTQKISSNLKMEERWTIKHLGHKVKNWGWDVMLATHCLDNRPHICSLKFQSFVKLGIASYNERIEPYLESKRGPYNRIHEIDMSDLLVYGGMDALQEHRVAMLQRKEMGYED